MRGGERQDGPTASTSKTKDQTRQGRTEGREKVTEEMRDGKPQDHIPLFSPFWIVIAHLILDIRSA